MTTLQKTFCASLVLMSVSGAGQLRAEDGSREIAAQINAANGLLRDGNVDGAIAAYRQTQESAPSSSDVAYNLAVAQYRKGDVSAAAHQFRSAATADNDAVAAKARFNLGNCDYVSALQLAEKDRPAAIERLQSAIGNYRTALNIDSSDADARANIELASQLIDKLREKDKQQQQNQQQQNQQQDRQQSGQGGDQRRREERQQEQQNQSQSAQENEDKKDKSGQDQSEQQNNQSKSDRPSEDERASKQKNQENETETEPKDTASRRRAVPSHSHQDAAKKHQDQRSTPLADEPNEKQGKAAPKGKLSAARQSDKKDTHGRREQEAAERSVDGEMTAQEAEKMLQAIRDREMMRRLRRQAAERNQHISVDRDW
jgi:Ca-activated chloride channel family protein